MKQPKVTICIPFFNNEQIAKKTVLSCLNQRGNFNLKLILVDDGSQDKTPEILKSLTSIHKNIILHLDEHKERGSARVKAIEEALEKKSDYIIFIDSDMQLQESLVAEGLQEFETKPQLDALIIQEKAVSQSTNYASKLKCFERNMIRSNKKTVSKNTIEAARFWKSSSYEKSGGINPKQISFEEIQPTIRIINQGGHIERLQNFYLQHDEGFVSFKNLIQKKSYYFSQIKKTTSSESGGKIEALKRWYFFRPYLYKLENFKSPLLYLGVIYMYSILTLLMIQKTFTSNELSKKKEQRSSNEKRQKAA